MRQLYEDSCCWSGFLSSEESDKVIFCFGFIPVETCSRCPCQPQGERQFFCGSNCGTRKFLAWGSKLLPLINLLIITVCSHLCSNLEFYVVEIISKL